MRKKKRTVTCRSCHLPGHNKTTCKWAKEQATPEAKMENRVNSPAHYADFGGGVECIDIVEHLPFNRGNAIKYLWRVGKKGNAVEDLKKAAWYIEREIKRISDTP